MCKQPQHVMSQVIASVVGVQRRTITLAWMDAITTGEWSQAQSADVAALLAVEQRLAATGRRPEATGTGIDLDLSRDDEFGLLVRLAPYSIHSEAWADSVLVFSCSDSGNHAWFALTPAEATSAADSLADAGFALEEVLTARE